MLSYRQSPHSRTTFPDPGRPGDAKLQDITEAGAIIVPRSRQAGGC